MSAIVAVLDLRGGAVDDTILRRSLQALDERGPHGARSMVDGPVGLGQQSLALTPDEASYGPQLVGVGDVHAVFDGRLDNRDELLREFHGVDKSCVTDGELVARSYDLWGIDCVRHLIGDFGFVCWDARRKKLFSARDQLGIRPLYHWSNGRLLIISTDVRAILAEPSVPVDPNEACVRELLHDDMTSTTATLYTGIERLPPAHWLCAVDGGVRMASYWDADIRMDLVYRDSQDYVDHYRSLVTEAVRCRLRTTRPVTVSLSGGRDSSFVLAVAAREAAKSSVSSPSLSGTSLVYPGLECDESDWIDLIASAVEVPSRRVVWTPRAWEDLEDAARVLRYLPTYPNAMLDRFAEAGSTKSFVFTGIGGDEWMKASFSHFRDLWGRHRYLDIAANVVQGGGRGLGRAAALAALARVHERVEQFTPGSRNADPWWLGPRFRDGPAVEVSTPAVPFAGLPRARWKHYGTLHLPWQSHAFEVTDRASAQDHLVCTHPLNDVRIVEFALSVDDAERWHGSERRWIQRRAMDGVVPDATAKRQSEPVFTASYVVELSSLATDLALRNSHVVRNGWVSAKCGEIWPASRSRRSPTYLSVERAWCIAAVEAWSRAAWG